MNGRSKVPVCTSISLDGLGIIMRGAEACVLELEAVTPHRFNLFIVVQVGNDRPYLTS